MVCTGSKQSIDILKSEYFQNMTWEMTWEFWILNYEAIFTKFLAQAFFEKAGWMVNFEIDHKIKIIKMLISQAIFAYKHRMNLPEKQT